MPATLHVCVRSGRHIVPATLHMYVLEVEIY